MGEDPKSLERLKESLSLLRETEEVAKDTAACLQVQREKLTKAKSGMKRIDADLEKSNRIVTRMKRREECILL